MTQPFAEAQHQPAAASPAPAVAPVSAASPTPSPTLTLKTEIPVEGKPAKTMINEGGVWKPFRIFDKKQKPSEVREGFAHYSACVDEDRHEIEQTEASLAFLRAQIADGEKRLASLRTKLASNAKLATEYLAKMHA